MKKGQRLIRKAREYLNKGCNTYYTVALLCTHCEDNYRGFHDLLFRWPDGNRPARDYNIIYHVEWATAVSRGTVVADLSGK